MSWQPGEEPECIHPAEPVVDQVIRPRAKDIGGFEVRRVLPAAQARAIGPFVFFDHLGPATLPAGKGIDVRPHPHIGLSTLTWLFDGALMHRDSLGTAQEIRPGAVNWMTAGRGIVHSERSPEALRARDSAIEGIQTWHALPADREETEPDFQHVPAADLPFVEQGGVRVTLIAGGAFGMVSPVRVFSETLYADIRMAEGGQLGVPLSPEARAIYVVRGGIEIGGRAHGAHEMLVLRAGTTPVVRAGAQGAHLVLIGGADVGPRHLWWNFVSSRPERIAQAKADWAARRFPKVPGDEAEFIPLPEE